MVSSVCIGACFAQAAGTKTGRYIFDYKTELSLTDKQEKNMRDILAKLQSYLSDKKKELDGLKAELDMLVERKGDLNTIKAKLQDIARVQTDASYEDIVSARAIENELTAKQLSKWRSIQKETRQAPKQ
ncbi:MAG: hypothetical protein WC491_01830 [Candidatus Omnitrophota bacterium]